MGRESGGEGDGIDNQIPSNNQDHRKCNQKIEIQSVNRPTDIIMSKRRLSDIKEQSERTRDWLDCTSLENVVNQ